MVPDAETWLDAEINDEARNAKKECNEQWMRYKAAMIDRVDQNLARIVEVLRQHGQFDNTLILFLSDNGSDEERMRPPPPSDPGPLPGRKLMGKNHIVSSRRS